jgi:predicted AAA+ superfamily ATPase
VNFIRDATIKAEKYLDTDQALIFVGPRQAGKTFVLHQLEDKIKVRGGTVFFLNLEDPDYLKLLDESPKNLFRIFPIDLNRKSFVLIDEVQYLDNPTNFLKFFFDGYRGKIKILASGSSSFYLDRKFKDSLAGRKTIFYVLTLSFKEFLRFKGQDELAKKDLGRLTLSEKEEIDRRYGEYIIWGGYPRAVLAEAAEKKAVLEDIVYSYIKKDVLEAGVRQDETFFRLLKILATQAGNLVNSSELAGTLGVSKTAVDNYLYVMQKSFHISLIKPFFKNVRKELTKMPKVYFFDLGLRNFLTGNRDSFGDRNDRGALLENAVYRQLADSFNFDQIKFWRTAGGREVDFIVDERLGFEVKVEADRFRQKKYKMFFAKYPDIDVSIVSLGAGKGRIAGRRVFEVWEIGTGRKMQEGI